MVLVNGLYVFNKTFFYEINRYDFKTKIRNDTMIDGYNFLKSISDKYQNALVCTGYYSPIPGGPSGFKKVLISHFHLHFAKQIKNNQCGIIVLDSSTPGRYIWFNNNLDNLIIRKYETLSDYEKLFGKEGVEKTQQLIEFIIKDPASGYRVIFFNSKIVVLLNKSAK